MRERRVYEVARRGVWVDRYKLFITQQGNDPSNAAGAATGSGVALKVNVKGVGGRYRERGREMSKESTAA